MSWAVSWVQGQTRAHEKKKNTSGRRNEFCCISRKLNFRISTHKETNSVVSAAGSVHRKIAL